MFLKSLTIKPKRHPEGTAVCPGGQWGETQTKMCCFLWTQILSRQLSSVDQRGACGNAGFSVDSRKSEREEMWTWSLSCSCVRIMILKKSTLYLCANGEFKLSPQWMFPFSHVIPVKPKKEPWGHDCWWISVSGCISFQVLPSVLTVFPLFLGHRGDWQVLGRWIRKESVIVILALLLFHH